jgi:hypothetical protein
MENLTKNSIKISVPMINTGTKSPVTSLLIILAFYLYFLSILMAVTQEYLRALSRMF